jgi:hypothetical protein
MNAHIRHDHEELLESLVRCKLPRNLTWSAVVELIGQIGEVQPHGNDEFAFVVGSQKEFFKRPSRHNLEGEAISHLRKFLRKAEVQRTLAEARGRGAWRSRRRDFRLYPGCHRFWTALRGS